MISEHVSAHHLSRKAVIYVRQSTPNQVLSNQESTRLQYALRQRAVELGWNERDIEIIDTDLGLTARSAANRQGFTDLIGRVTLGEIGLILSWEVTRLSRNCTDWYPLLDLCGYYDCLIADRDGVYNAGTANGRLLLGLKGTISEIEMHTLRGRLTAGLLNKAERGDLALARRRAFEDRQEREVRVLLELHSSPFSSGMNGPAIMPWLRKNDSTSALSRASIVRIVRTPARRKPAEIASSRREPTPACRASGWTSIPNTQPQGGEPNSQSRTSPMMKPTTREPVSATRNWRPSAAPP